MNDQVKMDAEKTATSNNESLPKVETSETGLPAATTPMGTPTAVSSVETAPTPGAVVEAPKKKSSCLKVGLIGCGILFLLLILCLCIGFLTLPSILKSATSTSSDFNKSDYSTYQESATKSPSLQDKIDNAEKQNPNGSYTVTVTEQDVVNQIASNPDSKDLAKAIFIKMSPDLMSVKIELSTILNSIPNDQRGGLDPQLFKDVFVGADVTTTADGKQFQVKKVTTGNSIIDGFIGDGFKESFEKGLNEALTQDKGTGVKVTNIKIKDKAIDITFSPTSSIE